MYCSCLHASTSCTAKRPAIRLCCIDRRPFSLSLASRSSQCLLCFRILSMAEAIVWRWDTIAFRSCLTTSLSTVAFWIAFVTTLTSSGKLDVSMWSYYLNDSSHGDVPRLEDISMAFVSIQVDGRSQGCSDRAPDGHCLCDPTQNQIGKCACH